MGDKGKGETMSFLRFERALPHQVRELIAQRPIAYVPFGALEWHGEHSALGLDGLKARWICEQAAERTGGVLFPTVYWGAFHAMPFPFTFHFAKRSMKKQVRIILRSLADWGFRSIVLLTGHYPVAQITLLRRECRRIARRRKIGALGIPEQALATDLGYLGDHAAKWETSILMAIDPSLVDLSRLPDDTGSLAERSIQYGIDGISPNNADAELGRRTLETIVERLAVAVQRMLEEGNANAAEEVYRTYGEAFRNLFEAGRTAFGVDSKWEIARFVLRNIIRYRHL